MHGVLACPAGARPVPRLRLDGTRQQRGLLDVPRGVEDRGARRARRLHPRLTLAAAAVRSRGRRAGRGGEEETVSATLEQGPDLLGQALERLVVEGSGAVDIDVVEAEVEVRRPVLGDQLGRAL